MIKRRLITSGMGILLFTLINVVQPVYAFGPESNITYQGIDVIMQQ